MSTAIRINKSGGHEYRQLVERKWDPEKKRPVTRVLAHLGRADRPEIDMTRLPRVTVGMPYIGSKMRIASSDRYFKLVDEIDFNGYLEPFLGSAAIYLQLAQAGRLNNCEAIVLNDLDGNAFNYFRQAKLRPKQLAKDIDSILYSQDALDVDLKLMPDLQRAAFYAAKMHMKMMGSASNGSTIDIRARSDTGQIGNNKLVSWNKYGEKIVALSHYLKCAQVLNWDALKFIERMAVFPGSLMIVDPPYIKKDYYDASFTEHEKLAEALTSAPCNVILHHDEHPALRDLYPEKLWEYHSFEIVSTANHSGKSKPKKQERVLRRRDFKVKSRQLTLI